MCKLDRGLMAPSNPAGSYPTPRPPHPARLHHWQKDEGEPKSGGSFGSERETRPNKGMQPTRYRARLMPGVGRLPPQLQVL